MSGHRTPGPDAVLYPLEPLAALVGCSLNELGRRVGLSGSTWKHYRTYGVSEKVADRAAVRMGLHPFEVWPELADHGIRAVERPCDECDAPFIPRARTHRFCNPRCARRHNARVQSRKRLATPEGRAENAERVRRWRAGLSPAAKRAQAAKQAVRAKAWYEANRERQMAKAAEWRRERYHSDEVYRQRVLAKQRVRDRAKAEAKRLERAGAQQVDRREDEAA